MKWSLAMAVGVVVLAGCSQKPADEPDGRAQPVAAAKVPAVAAAKQEPASKDVAVAAPAPEPDKPVEAGTSEEKGPDLGPPLVDPAGLRRLDPKSPVFIDKEKKQVVLVGQVCQREAPLEMFACLRHTKEHEAVVTIATKAMLVHAALLAIGAEPGEPAHFHPKFSPARGQEVEIEVLWKDAQGKLQRARAQDWVKNLHTGKSLEQAWVFAGSGFWTDPDSGQRHYQAESGDLICVSNFASATLDLTVQSSSSNDALEFQAFAERIPPKGTPVTLVLTPQKKKH